MKSFVIFSVFFCASLLAQEIPIPQKRVTTPEKGFTLLDKVCVVVEGEEPILLNETKKRAEQRGEAFTVALKEMMRERLLWVYAKKQLKYDVTSVFKATDEHIGNVMEKNHLTRQQFEDVLLGAPYFSTYRQFRLETATEYLKNSVRQNLAGQISVNDDQLRNEAALQFDVVLIKVRRTQNRTPLTAEINKANAIRRKIQPTTNVNDIKIIYGHDRDITILGPIAFGKDVLKKAYEDRLKSDSSEMVLGPFEDDGSLTIIWKQKKTTKNLDDATLEKLRKERYQIEVQEKYDSLTDALMNSSTVIEKGCGKL